MILIFCHLLFSCNGKASHQTNIESNIGTTEMMSKNTLEYKLYGQGEKVIVLIHGLGSNSKAWKKLTPFFEEEYKIYAVDLPKYLDVDDKSGVGISKYSKLVTDFINNLDESKAHIIGHSMGAQVAMHVAINSPEVVKSLALLAPAGLEQFSTSDKEWFNKWISKSYFLNLSDQAISKSFDINFYGSKLPEDAQFMLDDRLALKTDTIRYERYVEYLLISINSMLDETVFDQLSKIDVPTLVLFGKDDQLIPNQLLHNELSVNDVLSVANNISDSEAHIIEQAGHFIQWDRPEEVASKISTFFNNNFTNE